MLGNHRPRVLVGVNEVASITIRNLGADMK